MRTPYFPAWRPRLAPVRSPLRKAAAPVRRATLCQLEQILGPALPPELLQKPAAGPHSRRRVFCLSRTFWCWLWQIFQANTSCREVLRQLQALLGLLALPPVNDDASAYCQARHKLPADRLKAIFQASFQSAENRASPPARLQGRPVKVVDASTVRLEDTPKNRTAYPAAANQFGRPGFPLLKLLVLFSLRSGALLARASGSLQAGETRLLMGLAEHLRPGDILVGDRAYGLYVLLHWTYGLGADLVARLNCRSRRVDFRQRFKKLGPGDALFRWSKPQVPSQLLSPQEWAQLPDTMVVRIVRRRITQAGFRTRELTLVTTLTDAQLYPADELCEVYFQRWRLEMCLDDLKTTLGMEKLNGRSPELVQKELLLFLTAHNLLRWIMAQAAATGSVALDRISFKGTLDALRQWSLALAQVCGPGKRAKQKILWHQLLGILARDLVPDRPGRREPRAVKKKSKYPRLTGPRHRYVDRWSRNKKRRVQRAKQRRRLN